MHAVLRKIDLTKERQILPLIPLLTFDKMSSEPRESITRMPEDRAGSLPGVMLPEPKLTMKLS